MKRRARNRRSYGNSIDQLVEILFERYAQGLGRHDVARAAEVPKIVVVLGAGASLWSGMPIWNASAVKERVITAAKGGFSEFTKEALRKLEHIIGVDGENRGSATCEALLRQKATTDMLCSVASDSTVARELVLRELSHLYGSERDLAGPRPQLLYEILAHLMRHGFVDDVVTFNFDDLMGTAVSNEMSDDDFTLINSDHAVRDDLVEQSEPTRARRRPRVLQIHGSIRARATLRFTRDETGVLMPRTKAILWDTFFGDDRPVHIVSLGYSWNDPDFAGWICSHGDLIRSVTVVTREGTIPQRLANASWGIARRGPGPTAASPDLRALGTEGCAAPGQQALSLDHLMWCVWDRVYGRFTTKKQTVSAPPSIARHLILSMIYGPALHTDRARVELGQLVRKAGDPDGVAYYVEHTNESRLKTEIVLHAIKCRGMVNASVMARDRRIRRYSDPVSPAALVSAWSLLKQTEFPDVRETMFLSARSAADFARIVSSLAGKDAPNVVLVPCWKKGRVRLESVERTKFLTAQVEAILRHPEIEIVREADPRVHWLFSHPQAITNIAAMHTRTRELLAAPWTDLFAVAETGEWLAGDLFQGCRAHDPRDIFLISASLPREKEWTFKGEDIAPKLRKTFAAYERRKLTVHEARLAWWQHNRHLTLTVDTRNRRRPVLGALYFHRPNKNHRVSPVFLEDADDCAAVMITFLAYVRRALERLALERIVLAEAAGRFVDVPQGFVAGVLERVRRLLDCGAFGNAHERVASLVGSIERLDESIALRLSPRDLLQPQPRRGRAGSPAPRPVVATARRRPGRARGGDQRRA